MKTIIQIDSNFIENNTNFSELVAELRTSFSSKDTMVPMRHHHDFANPKVNADSTLLLMPAWNPSKDAGVKIVTVSPENQQFDLPSINGTYIYLDATKGTIKAILEAKSLTAKRTAAASALASSFLSRENSSSLLMLGTGSLSINLIKAHASVRPIKNVFIWGRNFSKAQAICETLKNESFTITAVKTIEEKISEVDIISSATLSKTPLVLGKYLKAGQHVDLVGAYKKDMREADNEVITKGSVYIDTYQGGLKESGDILIPLQTGVLKEENINADLFELCSDEKTGRKNEEEITVFKSVGHALEDLVAASYYYKKHKNQ
ncbi:ornithine cyclodeaminase family protein [Tenacibaculum piscium]|uniref:ornithine cyclodeaminase family protein n=1 Tax=Tenacibaculum piscium TaxID=1458515 RepID=UPI001EFB631A|nr:ornithine cyclodeaminase family protein [Tenacibaculum piscium]MCG8182887.1 ornithine cyclodeaminase family protein [Tenacibaculum piscium]MCG8204279.1 ornithine cyclodeaminase family protein [Tenacibaculum piscium]